MRYYFAPMEGLTDSVYRRLHHKYFPGVDRYYMPFFSPTVHRQLTQRESRELPETDSVSFAAVPQVLTKVPRIFSGRRRSSATGATARSTSIWAAPPGRSPPRARARGC